MNNTPNQPQVPALTAGKSNTAYKLAYNKALAMANTHQREMGIEKAVTQPINTVVTS